MQAARAQDACAALAADPGAVANYRGNADFMSMLSEMSKSCPEVVLTLGLPLDVLAELGLAGQQVAAKGVAEPAGGDAPVDAVPPPSVQATYIAMIDAAAAKLDTAVAEVTVARKAVDAALGNVKVIASRQAMAPQAPTLISRLGFGQYAAERREAVQALSEAKKVLADAQDNLAKVVTETAKAVSDADAELAKAKLAISDVFDDADYPVAERIDELSKSVESAEAQLGKLNAELEPLQKAYDAAVAKVKAAEAPYIDAQGRYTTAYNRLVEINSICKTECTLELESEAGEVDKAIKQAMVDVDTASKAIIEASKARNEVAGKKEGVTQAIEGQVRYVANLRSEQDSYIALDKAATDAVTAKKAAEGAQTVQTGAAQGDVKAAGTRLSESVLAARDLLQVSEAERADAAALKAAAETLDTAGLALGKAAAEAREVVKTVADDPSAEVKQAAGALDETATEAESIADNAADAVERAKEAEAENDAAIEALEDAMPPSKG